MQTIWKSSICGALGGLAGAWAMQHFRILWERRPDASPESGIFGFDEEADIKSVDQVCSLLSLPAVSEPEALRAAMLLHYGYGAFAGAAYGAMRRKLLETEAGSGLTFGLALWLFGDELAITAAGLSDPATRKASAHVSALFAHLLFGGLTAASQRLLSKVRF